MGKVSGVLVAGVALGACCMYVLHRLDEANRRASPEASLRSLDGGDGEGSSGAPGILDSGEAAGPKPAASPLNHLVTPRPLVSDPLLEPGGARPGSDVSPPGQPVTGVAVQRAVSLGQAAFDEGNILLAKRYWQSAFHQGKDLDLVHADLASAVKELLNLDDDPRGRKEYLLYLQQRGAGSEAFEKLLGRASSLASSKESTPLKSAWTELSIAYEAAIDEEQRQKVLAILEPYLDRMVFSGRFTPLINPHLVRSGDSLWKIATRFHTTTDAIRRLNDLPSEMIQPRMRLKVLAGKVSLFIDKSDYRLWVNIDDRTLLHRRVGLGRDSRTPVGRFVVRVKKKDPVWYVQGGSPIPAGDPRNILGSRWLGFEDSDRASGIGIHATKELADIGQESSAGCIRLHTPDMELVYDFIPRGTVVIITE